MAKGKTEPEVVEQNSSAVALLDNHRALPMSTRQTAVEAVSSLSELKALFGNQELDWQSIEPSFKVADKETLEGVPFVIAGFRLNESTKFGKRDENGVLIPSRFVSMLIASYDDEGSLSPWVIVNDGGTGIRDQLDRFVKKVNPDAGITLTEFNLTAQEIPPIRCENGLRPSRYDYDNGESVSEATTWYIA